MFRAVNRLAIVKNLPHEINERQIAGFFSEPDADLAEAARRDVELDENPSLGLTLGEFDTKIGQRVFFSKKIESEESEGSDDMKAFCQRVQNELFRGVRHEWR